MRSPKSPRDDFAESVSNPSKIACNAGGYDVMHGSGAEAGS